MSKRIKTNYPGIFYRESKRVGGHGSEKVYYVVYKKNGVMKEQKAGRQYADNMTPAKAASIRSELIENKRMTRKELREQQEAIKKAEAGKWTIERLWAKYKANRPNLKGLRTYESAYNLHVGPVFGSKEPQAILPLDITRVENKLLKKRAPQTVWHVLELLRRIVNFGVKNFLCPGLDFKIDMPKVDNILTEDLTPDELERLLKAIADDSHPQAGTMMKLVLCTGVRKGELFRLQWGHIDFERGFITLVETKGDQKQTIPLNESAKDLLLEYRRLNPIDSPYVFPGRNGGQRQTIAAQVRRIKVAADLPKAFRPLHGLRHFFASQLANSGEVDMYQLQKLLTHKDSKMTERYAHLRDKALKKASNVAGNIISQAASKKDEKKVVNLEDHRK